MRYIKKIVIFAMSFILALGLGMSFVKADDETYDVTFKDVNYAAGATLTGSYYITKVIDGDITYNSDTGEYEIKFPEFVNNCSSETYGDDAAQFLWAYDDATNDEKMSLLANDLVIGKYSGYFTVSHRESYTLEDQEPGFYVIRNYAKNFKIVGAFTVTNEDTTVYVKDNISSTNLKKYVKDENGEWKEATVALLNEILDYKIEATITDAYDEYSSYTYYINDYNYGFSAYDNLDNFVIKIDGTVLTDDQYEIHYGSIDNMGNQSIYSDLSVDTDGFTSTDRFFINFGNLKENSLVKAGSVITVEYKAKVLKFESYADYSSNFTDIDRYNDLSNYKATYATNYVYDNYDNWDQVFVYNLMFMIVKRDEKGNLLSGADFTLYDEEGNEVTNKQTADSVFIFLNLKAGTYTLKETTTPEGYKTCDDMEITISYTSQSDGSIDVQYTSDELEFFNYNDYSSEKQEELQDLLYSYNIYHFDLSKNKTGIQNTSYPGIDLPFSRFAVAEVTNYIPYTLAETGGIGNYKFFAVGIGLIVIAAVYFEVRKKRSTKE